MMLTGNEIKKMVREGRITISPFFEERVNPNSYNLEISDKLIVYPSVYTTFDTRNPKQTSYLTDDISEYREGYRLYPRNLYLASTVEECGSDEFVCCLEGRSSLARMGISVHLTAGFGDLGFKSRWTLEMTVQFPTIVYPKMQICQAVFHTTQGDRSIQYVGKYKDQSKGATASRFDEERNKGHDERMTDEWKAKMYGKFE